jgi:cytochrome c peroxidase
MFLTTSYDKMVLMILPSCMLNCDNQSLTMMLRYTLALILILMACPLRAEQGLGLPAANPEYSKSTQPTLTELGQKLFFDPRLSVDGKISCSTCHDPDQGFTQLLSVPVGVNQQLGSRNTPTLLNIAYHASLFHDGRETTLEDLIWSPLLSPAEMGNATKEQVYNRLASLEDYTGQFDTQGQANKQLGRALASFQRTLVAANSKFDQWYYGNIQALATDDIVNGFAVFNRHGCAACHTINDGYALFSDGLFHNTGLAFKQASISGTIDNGRFDVTGKASDKRAFRTPTLRNIALTAPYMHDGSMASLKQVIQYYMEGGFEDPAQDSRLLPFILNETEINQLTSFLDSLTSPSALSSLHLQKVP